MTARRAVYVQVYSARLGFYRAFRTCGGYRLGIFGGQRWIRLENPVFSE